MFLLETITSLTSYFIIFEALFCDQENSSIVIPVCIKQFVEKN